MIRELASDYKSFEEFNNAHANGHLLWYHGTTKSAIDNMTKGNGLQTCAEHYSGQCYGRGLYGLLERTWSHYGNACLCCIVKKEAVNHFLFFSKHLRDKYSRFIAPEYRNETIKDEIERLAPGLISERDLNGLLREWEHNPSGGGINYFQSLTGDRGNVYKNTNNLKKLDESGILGYVFMYGGSPCLVLRSYDCVMPYRYWENHKDIHGSELIGNGTPAFENEYDFDSKNIVMDYYNKFCKEYPQTSYPGMLIAGFGYLVRKEGNKNRYNYASAWTEDKISPFDFDFASPFIIGRDRTEGRAQCGWFHGGSRLTFTLMSKNMGKNLEIYLNVSDKQPSGSVVMPQKQINYEQFIGIAKSIKASREKKINEKQSFFKKCLNEALHFKGNKEDFRDKLHDEESNEYNDNFSHDYAFVYATTSEKNVDNILKGGQNREYLGTSGDSGLAYGLTISTCLTIKAAMSNTSDWSSYGNAIIKYAVKGGFKDFLIFKNNIRKKYDGCNTVYDELVRIIPKDVMPDFKNALYSANHYQNPDFCHIEDYKKNCDTNGHPVRCIINAIKGKYVGKINNGDYYDEKLFSKTRIRGFIFHSGLNGDAVMIRDYGSIIPVSYSLDKGKTWIKNKYLDDDAVIDMFNKNVDAYHSYRHEYQNIHHFNDRQRCGYVRVSGADGENYMNVDNDRHLLPVNVSKAVPFDPVRRLASFTAGPLTFVLSLKDKEDCDIPDLFIKAANGNTQKLPYNVFWQVIQKLLSTKGALPSNKIYTDNILQELQ